MLQNGDFANWSAAVARHFSKLHALVSLGRKAPMRAISGVAAERSKSTAWMWELINLGRSSSSLRMWRNELSKAATSLVLMQVV